MCPNMDELLLVIKALIGGTKPKAGQPGAPLRQCGDSYLESLCTPGALRNWAGSRGAVPPQRASMRQRWPRSESHISRMLLLTCPTEQDIPGQAHSTRATQGLPERAAERLPSAASPPRRPHEPHIGVLPGHQPESREWTLGLRHSEAHPAPPAHPL